MAFWYCFASSSYRLFFESLFSSHKSEYPGLSTTTFLPMYLTGGCISHCCIAGGKHAIYVYVIIPQANDWCKCLTYCCLKCVLPHLGCFTSQSQTSVLTGLAFWFSSDKLERASSPSHHHFLCQLQETPCPMDVND